MHTPGVNYGFEFPGITGELVKCDAIDRVYAIRTEESACSMTC